MLGEMLVPVEELVSAGFKCFDLPEEQEGAITVAATLQVARDVRNVMEVCAAQLVSVSVCVGERERGGGASCAVHTVFCKPKRYG